MGCVSSSLLNQDEPVSELRHISMGMGMAAAGSSTALGHHIVSLTSTTYGLLTLDYPPPQSNSQSQSPPPQSESQCWSLSSSSEACPEVINSWELMAGLDSIDSFRFPQLSNTIMSNSCSSSRPPKVTPKFFPNSNSNSNTKPKVQNLFQDTENCNPNVMLAKEMEESVSSSRKSNYSPSVPIPKDGENKVVLYTTSLRGVRSTFEACNAVRSALQSLGFSFSERDISMDRGFRDELNLLRHQLQPDDDDSCWAPPRLFVRGRYVGSADKVLQMYEDGELVHLFHGITPSLKLLKPGSLCDGCGGFCFLPCFRCHGSCKLVMLVSPTHNCNYNETVKSRRHQRQHSTVVIKCPDCNENGLIVCPLCS